MRRLTEERDAQGPVERRKEARFRLILRAGLLEQEGRTSFCLVKNISTSGVQLKTYAQPVLNAAASLRIADEQAITGDMTWINGDNAGLSLHEELDAATLLRVRQKLRPNKRRALPRMSIDSPALLRTGGRVLRASLTDISSLGARLRLNARLKAGDRTTVQFPDLPAISAYVRWSEDDEVGLAFDTPIPMQIIADWINGRDRVLS